MGARSGGGDWPGRVARSRPARARGQLREATALLEQIEVEFARAKDVLMTERSLG
ncbi:hypothetical protein DB30_01933 [Enhygromyxa salina]|uniref:Uncharacterized protein n=1 Tax=Enhygromyxa salina TaxID=215803 RepID=A0A0C2D4B9_9BACT|nr:hypothetical protein DB30_01933 [Enhygromyxa salina]